MSATDPRAEVPAAPVDDAPRARSRVSTVVWGLMLAAAGVWILAWAAGARIDGELALIVLVATGGAALLIGSILAGVRRHGQ